MTKEGLESAPSQTSEGTNTAKILVRLPGARAKVQIMSSKSARRGTLCYQSWLTTTETAPRGNKHKAGYRSAIHNKDKGNRVRRTAICQLINNNQKDILDNCYYMVTQSACKNNSCTTGPPCWREEIIYIINENNFKDNAVLLELVVILKKQLTKSTINIYFQDV